MNITDKEIKQTSQRPQHLIENEYPTENELRKLSDKELDEYSSKLIKELIKSFEEVGEFENY